MSRSFPELGPKRFLTTSISRSAKFVLSASMTRWRRSFGLERSRAGRSARRTSTFSPRSTPGQAFDDEQRPSHAHGRVAGRLRGEGDLGPTACQLGIDPPRSPCATPKARSPAWLVFPRGYHRAQTDGGGAGGAGRNPTGLCSARFDGVVEVDGQLHIVGREPGLLPACWATPGRKLVASASQDVEGNEKTHEQVGNAICSRQLQRERAAAGSETRQPQPRNGRLIDLETQCDLYPRSRPVQSRSATTSPNASARRRHCGRLQRKRWRQNRKRPPA